MLYGVIVFVISVAVTKTCAKRLLLFMANCRTVTSMIQIYFFCGSHISRYLEVRKYDRLICPLSPRSVLSTKSSLAA